MNLATYRHIMEIDSTNYTMSIVFVHSYRPYVYDYILSGSSRYDSGEIVTAVKGAKT